VLQNHCADYDAVLSIFRVAFSFTKASASAKILHLMAGRITIDTERCKGCGLCVAVCPQNGIVISNQSNKTGYFPAQATNANCTGCCMCAIACPDVVIEVYRDNNIVAIEPDRKKKSRLTEEKV
jgi:2-oxoglutarate ferredoxin oxidoreductase subunit delta